VGPSENYGSIVKSEKQLHIAFHAFLLSLITDNFTITFKNNPLLSQLSSVPRSQFPNGHKKKPNKLMVEGCCRSITPSFNISLNWSSMRFTSLSPPKLCPVTTINYGPHNLTNFFLVSVANLCN
jgi:hypothetical protein